MRPFITMIACLLEVALLSACGVDQPTTSHRVLTYEDFISRGPQQATGAETGTPGPREDSLSAPNRSDPAGDQSGPPGTSEPPNSAVREDDDPPGEAPTSRDPLYRDVTIEPGEEVIVDSLVGQINGRPIYANEFFAPIDDKLRVAREQNNLTQFRQVLAEEIRLHLREIMQSELLLAEAESRLTPEQQKGLIAWLTRQREDVISKHGGSEAVADVVLREQEGLEGGVSQAVTSERERALIQMLLAQEVRPRVIVSWRDIERAYQANYERYNPPGTATVAWIRLIPSRDDEKIELARERLEAGDDFLDVADAVDMSRGGILYEDLRLGPNGFADAEIIPEFRDRLAGLGEGETVGPFTRTLDSGGEWVVWLHVVDLEKPEPRSIYDVQRELREAILRAKFLYEQDRYFRELIDENITRDLSATEQRLFEIGYRRYAR